MQILVVRVRARAKTKVRTDLEESPLKRYFPSMKRYSWIIVVCIVLCAAAGAYVAKSQPTAYQVTASLLIQSGAPGTTYPGATAIATDSIAQAADDAAEIPTRSVMEFVYQYDPKIHAHHYSADDLLLDITVLAPSTTTSAIVITATATKPADAVMLATDAAKGYQAYKDKQAQDQLDALRGSYINQLKALQVQKTNWENQINRLPSTTLPQYTVYNNNLTDVTHNIDAVQTQLLGLPQTIKSDVFITQLPKITDVSATSKAALVIAVTAGLGLVLGILIMFLVIFLDNRLYGEDRIKEKLGFAYLGGLSTNAQLKNSLKNSPMQTTGATTQDVADICANLRLAEVLPGQWRAPQGAVLLVTSSRTAEGKTTVVSALAATVARGGSTVVVVEGNLRHPTTHLAFGISPAGVGLSGLLRGNGTESVDNAVQRSKVPGVWLLAGGTAMDDPTYMLSQKLPDILTQLRQKTDLVIIDGPPLLSGADAAMLATMVDGVAIVIDSRYDKMPLLLRTKEILSSLEHTPVGVILNRLPRRKKNRYFVAAYPGHTPAEKWAPVQTHQGNAYGNGQKPDLAASIMAVPPSPPVVQQAQPVVRMPSPPPTGAPSIANQLAPSSWVPMQDSRDSTPVQQNPSLSRPVQRRMDMTPAPPIYTGRDE